MRGSLLTRVKRLESLAESRKAASPAIDADDKPLSAEEQRQLGEADAALSAHDQGDLISSLSERTRIQLAPYAAVLQRVDGAIEERDADTPTPAAVETTPISTAARAAPVVTSSPLATPIAAAPSPIAPPAVNTPTIFTI